MNNVDLLRVEENFEFGTFGIWRVQKQVFGVTLEPRDEENQSFISSIPAQQYHCKRIVSPKFGPTFEVKNVPGRTNVELHPGNTVYDTTACIILAQHWGKLGEMRAVLNSGKTFESFMNLGWTEFLLTIYEYY